ncbi:hypothetical protein B0H19DRAFT_1072021 [Mycena capillaripes]|nr:hypothetical protein B0H19DRAFT_1072021 [Mycena capillaripes]
MPAREYNAVSQTTANKIRSRKERGKDRILTDGNISGQSLVVVSVRSGTCSELRRRERGADEGLRRAIRSQHIHRHASLSGDLKYVPIAVVAGTRKTLKSRAWQVRSVSVVIVHQLAQARPGVVGSANLQRMLIETRSQSPASKKAGRQEAPELRVPAYYITRGTPLAVQGSGPIRAPTRPQRPATKSESADSAWWIFKRHRLKFPTSQASKCKSRIGTRLLDTWSRHTEKQCLESVQ